MAVVPIRRFPDSLLKQPTRPVERVDATAAKLIDTLIATMRRNRRCVGLAAPQIGSPLRIAVMDSSANPNTAASRGLLVLVNPTIVAVEGGTVQREGCLSIPDLTANVRRATRVRVKAWDRDGSAFEATLEGFEATIVQHEVDHLDGKLFLDRVVNITADVFRRKTYS